MADSDDRSKDLSQIRREIEETRASMSKTVSALGTKLDPERLKAQATSALREKTIGRVENLAENASETVKGAGNDVFDAIKKNPLPAAIAAIGLGWLFMESKNEARQKPYRYAEGGRSATPYGYRYGYETGEYPMERDLQRDSRRPMDRMRETGENIQDRAGHMASNVGDKASDMASSVRDTAGEVAGNIGDKASDVAMSVRDTAGDVASNVRDTAEHVADRAQHQVYRARTRLEDLMDESPLLVGAAAVALGAAIGMSLPSTQKEDDLLGNVRDNLMEKAQETAKDTVDKVQHVAKEAGEAAQEAAKSEAQKQNLTTG